MLYTIFFSMSNDYICKWLNEGGVRISLPWNMSLSFGKFLWTVIFSNFKEKYFSLTLEIYLFFKDNVEQKNYILNELRDKIQIRLTSSIQILNI